MPNDQEGILVARSDSTEPFLFSSEVIKAITAAEGRGEYTAERFRVQHPDKYKAIITLRGLDWGQKRIADLLGVHHRTIAAVDEAEAESIDTVRQRLVRKLRRGASLLIDRVIDHPDTIPVHVLGLVASQLLDKAELLDGRATGRTEHVERVAFDQWEAYIEEKQLPPGDVREVASQIGLPGEEKPAIGAGDGDQAADPDARTSAAADSESDIQRPITQATPADVTGNATDPAHDPDPNRQGGGGGDASNCGGQDGPTDNATRKFLGNRPDPL